MILNYTTRSVSPHRRTRPRRILAVGSPQGLQRAAEETSSVTVEAKGDEQALFKKGILLLGFRQ